MAGQDRERARIALGVVRRSGRMWIWRTSGDSAADFDFGHAWHHFGRADGYQQLVRAGGAFEENIGAADVGGERKRQGADSRQQTSRYGRSSANLPHPIAADEAEPCGEGGDRNRQTNSCTRSQAVLRGDESIAARRCEPGRWK